MLVRRLRPGTHLCFALCALGTVLLAAAPALAQANRVLSVSVEGNQRISTDAAELESAVERRSTILDD